MEKRHNYALSRRDVNARRVRPSAVRTAECGAHVILCAPPVILSEAKDLIKAAWVRSFGRCAPSG